MVHEGAALSKSSTSISFVFSSGVGGGWKIVLIPTPTRRQTRFSSPEKYWVMVLREKIFKDSVYIYILERSSQVIIFLLTDGSTCHREQNLYYIFQYANLSCIASYYDRKISKSILLIFFGNLTLFRIFQL